MDSPSCSMMCSRLSSFWVGLLHKPIGRLQDRVPLDYLSSANLAINAATVGDGQFDIAYYVQRPAMSAGKIAAMSGCRHLYTMRLGAGGRHPTAPYTTRPGHPGAGPSPQGQRASTRAKGRGRRGVASSVAGAVRLAWARPRAPDSVGAVDGETEKSGKREAQIVRSFNPSMTLSVGCDSRKDQRPHHVAQAGAQYHELAQCLRRCP
jgi:hypothetical protein